MQPIVLDEDHDRRATIRRLPADVTMALAERNLGHLAHLTAVLIRMAHGLRSGRLGRDPAILPKLGHDPAYVDPIKASRVLSERKPL
jgi:hypothetical protein